MTVKEFLIREFSVAVITAVAIVYGVAHHPERLLFYIVAVIALQAISNSGAYFQGKADGIKEARNILLGDDE